MIGIVQAVSVCYPGVYYIYFSHWFLQEGAGI